jgi:hypothetical protein
MIRRLLFAALLIVLGGVLTYFSLGYHYVRTDDGWLMVPKTEMHFNDTFVDIREWSLRDYREHPELVEALVEDGHADVIPDQLTEQLREALDSLFRDGGSGNGSDGSGGSNGANNQRKQ